MHRPIPKRQQRIKLALVYSLMTTVVLLVVTILMFVILGYSFNQKDNRIEQGGLLQFASKPSGATVTLDEITMGSLTPSKTTADAHSHTAAMNLKDYRTWQKTIDLKPGMIGWLSYARLIPSDPKTEKLRSFATLAVNLTAPDNKTMVLVEDASKPTIILADLQNDTVKYETLTLPAASFTAPDAGVVQHFSIDSWSRDSRHILIKHTYGDAKVEWIVADIGDIEKAKNITGPLNLSSDKVIFGPRNGQAVFARSSDAIYKIKLDDQVLARPLVTNVDDFSIYNSTTLLYTTKADPVTKLRTVGYMNEDMQTGQTLGNYADDGQPIKIAMSEYFGKRYLATAYGTVVAVANGELPRYENKGNMQRVTKITTPAPIEWLSMSVNGRFVIAEAAGTYATYDLELAKTDTTKIKGVTGQLGKPLRWIDDYMTWSDVTGTLRLYEFDGANQQDIGAVAPGYAVSIAPNDKYLYSIGRDGNGFALQRVRMILK